MKAEEKKPVEQKSSKPENKQPEAVSVPVEESIAGK